MAVSGEKERRQNWEANTLCPCSWNHSPMVPVLSINWLNKRCLMSIQLKSVRRNMFGCFRKQKMTPKWIISFGRKLEISKGKAWVIECQDLKRSSIVRGLETRGPHPEFRKSPERSSPAKSVSRRSLFLCFLKTVQIASFSHYLSEMFERLLETWISFFPIISLTLAAEHFILLQYF